MQLRITKWKTATALRPLMLAMCSMVMACEPDGSLDEAGMMMNGGSVADATAAVSTSDAASTMTAQDAGVSTPGNAGGGNAGGGNTGGGNTGGGNTGGGNTGGADAASGAHDLDAGASSSDSDAHAGGVMIGPSVRRDGGPARWDPDAAGPILNPEQHAACMALAQNICTRVTDCQIELAELPASRRDQVFESCRSSFLVVHNCNRAVSTTGGFAACSEETKTRSCVSVFTSEFDSSCVDQITFQR